MNFKLTLILSFLLITFFQIVQAQVTIGSNIVPEKGAILDLKQYSPTGANNTSEKGLLLPKVKLEARNSLAPIIANTDPDITNLKKSHMGLMVYNVETTPITETDPTKILKPGIYTWDGSLWMMYIDNAQKIGSDANFFYMPSFNLPIATVGTGRTFNLYNEYAKQFKKTGNSMWVSSNSTLTEISDIYAATDLDYIVTGMSDNTVVRINSISTSGVLNYDVLSTIADPNFYINIILTVK